MNDKKTFQIDVNTSNAVKSTESLQSQLRSMQKQMAEMVAAGKEGTKEFEELSKKAGALKDAIGDAQQHIKRLADDTKGLNDVLDVMKSGISVFGLMQSATAALGIQNEKLTKSIQSLQAAQTALSSIQQLQQTLMDKSSATYRLLSKEIITYTGTSKAAAVATKALNIALKAIGIGLIVGAVTEIAAHIDDIRDGLGKIIPFLRDESKELEKQKQLEEERNNKIKERLTIQGEIQKLRDATLIAEGKGEEVYERKLKEAQKAEEAALAHLNGLNRVNQEYRNVSEDRLLNAKLEYEQARNTRVEAEKTLKAEQDRKKVKETTVKETKPKAEKPEVVSYDTPDLFWKLDPTTGAEMYDEIIEMQDEKIEIMEEQALSVIEIFKKIKAGAELSDEEKEKLQNFYNTLQDSISLIGQGADNIFDIVGTAIANEVKDIESNLRKVEKAIAKTDKAIDKHKGNLDSLYKELAESEGAKRDALLESIEVERTALNDRYSEQERLEKEQSVKEKELQDAKNKQEKANLANQLVRSIANTAISISTSMQAGFPAAIPFIAMAAATGAIQTGIIASQIGKLKYANGGLLAGPSHDNGGIPVGHTGIEVEGGEYIVNKRATAKYLPLLEALNNYGQSKTKFANGGEINLPQSDSLRTMTSINFTPVVAVTDINKANNRLSKVRVK